jgi:hypothetical protein
VKVEVRPSEVTTDSISEVVEVVKGVVGAVEVETTLSWAVDVSGGGVVESVVEVAVVEVVGPVDVVVDVSEVLVGDEDEDDVEVDDVVLVVEVVEVVGSDEVVEVVEVGVVEVVDDLVEVVEVVDVVNVVDVVVGSEVVVVVCVEEEELVEESVVDVFELAVVVCRFATLYTLEAKLTSSSANASTARRSDVNTPSLKCGYTACNA